MSKIAKTQEAIDKCLGLASSILASDKKDYPNPIDYDREIVRGSAITSECMLYQSMITGNDEQDVFLIFMKSKDRKENELPKLSAKFESMKANIENPTDDEIEYSISEIYDKISEINGKTYVAIEVYAASCEDNVKIAANMSSQRNK